MRFKPIAPYPGHASQQATIRSPQSSSRMAGHRVTRCCLGRPSLGSTRWGGPAAGASWLGTGEVVEGREGYVVVEAVAVRRSRLLVLLRPRRALLLPWLPIWRLPRLLALRPAAEQLHRAVDVDDDFRGVALDAVLLPLAGL